MLPAERYKQPEAGAVLAILHEISNRRGYLAEEEVRRAASELGVPLSQMYSAATFYTAFSFKPLGQFKLQLCEGTACYIKGAAELLRRLQEELGIEPDETTEDLLFTLREVHCVGSCGLAPVLRVNEETFGRLLDEDIVEILAQYRSGFQEVVS